MKTAAISCAPRASLCCRVSLHRVRWRSWLIPYNGLLNGGLLLIAVTQGLAGYQHQQRHQATQQQIVAIWLQIFGDSIPDRPLAGLQSRIRQRVKQQQSQQFFELVHQVHQALPASHQKNLHTLHFDGAKGEMMLTFNQAVSALFSALMSREIRLFLKQQVTVHPPLSSEKNHDYCDPPRSQKTAVDRSGSAVVTAAVL